MTASIDETATRAAALVNAIVALQNEKPNGFQAEEDAKQAEETWKRIEKVRLRRG